MSLIGLLVAVIVGGLIYYLITMLPLPAPFKTIAIVVFILICILWLFGYSGAFHSGPIFR
jgi:hypothetical protein